MKNKDIHEILLKFTATYISKYDIQALNRYKTLVKNVDEY